MKYEALRELKEKNESAKVCLFGAGLIGSTWAYDLLYAMGFHIDFYCDNGKKSGIEIRNGIETISPEELYAMKEYVLVFITVTSKYQQSIKTQLEKNGINNMVSVDYVFMQTFIESLLKMNDPCINEKFECILNDAEYICGQFEYYMGYPLNLDVPQTFNEKIQWLKLHDRNPEYTKLVDKYEVKKYISEKIGKQYIVPTLGIYDSFDEIDFNKLPKQFVLKCTHDSGSVVVCKDKSEFSWDKAREKIQSNLEKNYFWIGREWPYKNVKPRVLVEKYMVDDSETELKDYKFFCFNGEVKYLYVSEGLENHDTAKISFLTLDWKIAPFSRNDYKPFNELPKKPAKYSKMIEIAKLLSKDVPFVRVDLYEINGEIFFSELTFHPCSGFMPFNPNEWDLKLGSNLDIVYETNKECIKCCY